MQESKLIVLEGPDGTGKSTLAKALVAKLAESGVVRHHAFPGMEPQSLGQLIYNLHHDPGQLGIEMPTPTSLQALHIAAHLDAIERRLLPALLAGDWIVLDRFWWSTVVYGRVSGMDPDILEALINAERLAWRGWRPRVVFHVTRAAPMKDEAQGPWEQLRSEYGRLADRESKNHPVQLIVNTGTAESAVQQMVRFLGVQAC